MLVLLPAETVPVIKMGVQKGTLGAHLAHDHPGKTTSITALRSILWMSGRGTPALSGTILVIPGDALTLLCWSLLSCAASELKGQERALP